MKEFNIIRMVDGCHFADSYDEKEKEAICDFILRYDFDLNTFNIDDFIVNGLLWVSKEEYKDGSGGDVVFDKGDELLVTT